MAFPSTFLDVQNAVIIRARLDAVNDLQKAKDWINRAYFRVAVDAEIAIDIATLTFVPNAPSFLLPSEIARIKTMAVVPAGQTDTASEQPPMVRVPLENILSRRQNGQLQSQSGSYPTHFAVVGASGLEVWPTPAAADTIKVWYVAFPTPLAADGDVPTIEEPYASDLLEYGALVYAGDLLGDPSMADWQQSFQQTMGEYMAHLDAKAGTIPVHGHQWGSLTDTRELYTDGYGGW